MDTSSTDQLLDTIVQEMAFAANIIDGLHKRGYNHNFELIGNKLMCVESRQCFRPRDFWVDEIYQFNQEKVGLKGYFVYALREPSNDMMGIFSAHIVQDFQL